MALDIEKHWTLPPPAGRKVAHHCTPLPHCTHPLIVSALRCNAEDKWPKMRLCYEIRGCAMHAGSVRVGGHTRAPVWTPSFQTTTVPISHSYLYSPYSSFTPLPPQNKYTRLSVVFPQSYLPACTPTLPSSLSYPMSPCSTEYSHNKALVPRTSVSITSFSSFPCPSDNHVPRPRPFPNSYWATPLLVACEYPWTPMWTARSQKIDLLLRAGVRTFIDLTESGELCPYQPHLAAHVSRVGIDEEHEPVEYYSFPIPDRCLPRSVGYVRQILDVLKDNERRGRVTAVHCRGGIGRTGLVVGCWLVESGAVEDGAAALEFIAEEWKSVEKYRRFPQSPETGGQCEFVLNFERLQGSLVVPISP